MDDPADATDGWPVGAPEVGVDTAEAPIAPGSRDPAAVLRWALLGWGLGHVALGMRRGWLLLAIEVVWLALLGALLASLGVLAGERWLVVFGLFVGFVVTWAGQAVDAHKRASRRAGSDPGAMQLVVILFVTMLVLTGYWVVGGTTASPAATLQRYVSAWETDQPGRATGLFTSPHDDTAVARQWASDTAAIAGLVDRLAEQHDDWDLDTLRPYRDLRFVPAPEQAAPGEADYVVQVVRQAQLPTTLLGLHTTRSETQVVDIVGRVRMVSRASGAELPLLGQPHVWLIDDVHIGE